MSQFCASPITLKKEHMTYSRLADRSGGQSNALCVAWPIIFDEGSYDGAISGRKFVIWRVIPTRFTGINNSCVSYLGIPRSLTKCRKEKTIWSMNSQHYQHGTHAGIRRLATNTASTPTSTTAHSWRKDRLTCCSNTPHRAGHVPQPSPLERELARLV